MLTEPAKAFKGRLSFVWVDGNQFEDFVNNLGITELPGLMIVDGEGRGNAGAAKFKLQREFTEENVLSFFETYDSGSMGVYVKSQEVPDSQGNVFVTVGSTYKSTVNQPKAVLMELYAPWCGHCKKLEPEYEKVAVYFKDQNVVIAKTDATANDVSASVKGFPTLIYYPQDFPESPEVTYEGERTAEALIEFIEEKIRPPSDQEEKVEL